MKQFAFAAVALAGTAVLIFAAPDGAYAGGSFGGSHGARGASHGFHGRAGGMRHGARLNIGPLATRRQVIPRNIGPLAGRQFSRSHHRRHHHRGHGHGYDYAYSYGYGYGDAVTAEPLILQMVNDDPANLADALPEQQRIAHPVVRTLANSQQVCNSEHVNVPSSGGGQKTVTIIRC